MNALRDENDSPTLIGASTADNRTPIRALADPVTGYILARVVISSTVATPKRPEIDDNAKRVVCGVTNNAARTVSPLLSDPANPGYILADLTLI